MFFAGQFAFFTYLRPFLENVTGLSVSVLSLILLIMGLSGLAGIYLIGFVLKTRLFAPLIARPAALVAIAIALVALGVSSARHGHSAGVLGDDRTAAPVGWWTGLSETLPMMRRRAAACGGDVGRADEASDEEWALIGRLLPTERGRGRPAGDNRLFFERMMWMARTGSHGRQCRKRQTFGGSNREQTEAPLVAIGSLHLLPGTLRCPILRNFP